LSLFLKPCHLVVTFPVFLPLLRACWPEGVTSCAGWPIPGKVDERPAEQRSPDPAVQIPKRTPHTVGFTHLALRWFHSITWLLLALSFLLRELTPTAPTLANLVGITALGAYITFHIALSRAGASPKEQPEKLRPPQPDSPT